MEVLVKISRDFAGSGDLEDWRFSCCRNKRSGISNAALRNRLEGEGNPRCPAELPD
jgi:hypothetical protein